MKLQGTCRLCQIDRELIESHIFPKFIFDWMKRDSGPYLRNGTNPNRRLQDGFKRHLLCRDCEVILGRSETWFAEAFFRPFMNSFQLEFEYGPELFRFLISVHWRVLTDFLDRHASAVSRFLDALRLAEEQWRIFLLNSAPLPAHREVHLLFLDVNVNGKQPVRNLNRYLVNAVDGVVVRNETRCAVYSKFLRFLSYAWVTPLDAKLWVNTAVDPSGGHMSARQQMNDAGSDAAILGRAQQIGEQFNRTISDRQREKIGLWCIENAESILQSDLGRAIEADFSAQIDPTLGRKEKIGRNELCPCGSGRKFKKCCLVEGTV